MYNFYLHMLSYVYAGLYMPSCIYTVVILHVAQNLYLLLCQWQCIDTYAHTFKHQSTSHYKDLHID